MRIEDQFTVGIPVDEAWKVFLDLERIAPCMPGAQLQEVEGEEYRGIVKVKLGAITAQFKGVARFVEVDEKARRAVLRAEGREVRGQGNAAATVTATLTAAGEAATEVSIETDLSITGKVAQFGRGVMADVSSKLMGDFARRLEEDMLGTGEPTQDPTIAAEPAGATTDPSAGSDEAPASGTAPHLRTIEGPEVEPLDLMAVAGSSVAQRAVPAAVLVVLLLLAVARGRTTRWALALVGAALVGAREAWSRQSR